MVTADNLRDAVILVTGGDGFLGSEVCRVLTSEYGCKNVFVWNRKHDLTDYEETRKGFFDSIPAHVENHADLVFHLAGYNGGISFNKQFPADIFYRNTAMALNVLRQCQRTKVKKVVSVVASCAYPAMEQCFYDYDGLGREACIEKARERCGEWDFLNGPPHNSVSCHGYAKRNLQLASAFYKQQYGLNAVCACPTTLYGPGDNFDPERTKVMGAMVRRFVKAADEKLSKVVCWGTGYAKREFMYVTDAARLLVQTMLHYNDSNVPLNLGSGQEVTVRDLATMVATAAGFNGFIEWDDTKPDGQMRKLLDTTRMKEVLDRVEMTPLEEGIKKTVEAYRLYRTVFGEVA